MFQTISAVLIWSDNYRKLAKWYQDVLHLNKIEEIHHPNDTGVGFMVGTVYLWIGKHSKVKGKNQDPHRHMINFVVKSVSKTYEELKAKDVVFLASPFKAPTFDKYFATFTDPDNNILQIIGGK
ncbi:VOC family protein [Candidatus Gottesmanbacteria bacterium]|nr:VOC family protein [Candidatus Gottesmanbacteria bacterium]